MLDKGGRTTDMIVSPASSEMDPGEDLIIRMALSGVAFSQALGQANETATKDAVVSLRKIISEIYDRACGDVIELEDDENSEQAVTIHMDSLFLRKVHRYVCPPSRRSVFAESFKEVFAWACGYEIAPATYTVGHICEVGFSEQSATRCRVEDRSNIQALEQLDRLGLPVTCHFHSHPGHGIEANRPSPTDMTFQQTLESGGHICPGGIFSRDGYVRFFASDMSRFELEVHGNGIEKITENVFRVPLGK